MASQTKKKTRRKTGKKTARARAARRRITAEDLRRIVFVGTPQISPDGSRIVFAHKKMGEKNDYVSNLWMVATDGKTPPRQFTSGGKDGSPRFSPDGSRIAFTSGRDKPKQQIYLIDAAGGEATALTSFPEGTIGAFAFSPDGTKIAVSFREQDPDWTEKATKDREEKGLSPPPRVLDDWWYRLDGDGYFNGQRHHLYLIDIATGACRNLYQRDTLGFFTFDFSPDSKQLVIATNRDRKALIKPWKDELIRLNLSTGKVTAIPNLQPGPKSSPKWSPDGKTIAYAGREGTDSTYSVENLELWTCDAVRGGAKSLTGKTDYCLMAACLTDTAEPAFAENLQWRPDGKRIYVKIGWHGTNNLAAISPRGGSITMLTNDDVDYDIGNVSDDGKRIAMTVATTTKLGEICLATVNGDSAKVTNLTDLNGPLLKEIALARPTAHWVKTADGTKVHTWVMKPFGFKAGRRYPAVLEIHGGPHAQYGTGFFHEFQLLAAQGYMVFYSNPRGSKGYGRDHCAAIRGNWGSADWVDIQAVTEFMKNHANVNTKRMAVMGGSYGGYMTNWAIGHTNDFATAITDRCVSNLVSMGGTSDFIDAPDDYFPGNFWDRPEPRWDSSPIKYFGKHVKTPTLIIHSEGDLRCNVEQAEQVFVCLKLLNVPTRFVRYPTVAFHGFSRNGPPDLRLHRLDQIVSWLAKYLK